MATESIDSQDITNGAPSVRSRRPIRRYRESLACVSCRSKKLKCDKAHPCGSCVRRAEPSSCVFRKGNGSIDARYSRQQTDAQEKLEHLEILVKQLISSRGPPIGNITPPCTDSSSGTSPNDSSPGIMHEEENGPIYVGNTHWAAMLDDIKELKDVLRSDYEYDQYSKGLDAPITQDIDCLFGRLAHSSLEEVLSDCLPSRSDVDRCIDAYFGAKSISGPFIHTRRFMRQYDEFWRDPALVSPIWISILFSICHLSTKVGLFNASDQSRSVLVLSMKDQFLVASASCLVLGRYFLPQRDALEAIALYVQCKCTDGLDPNRELGVLLGIMLQSARMMGYHRDPEHLTGVTPFEKEMRRRTWALCLQLELLLSFQLGIPSNVQPSSWDTKLPANLLDSDFDEDTAELPPARPETELTRVVFFIAKQKLMIAFERVFRHALATNYNNESELKTLDRDIRDTYLSLPELMRDGTASHVVSDDAQLIATRNCVDLIYQKSLCVLHRKYVTQGREASIEVCISTATTMTTKFMYMYEEFKPGGRLYADRWLLSSIMWNDFLLGVNVLCLVLASHHRKSSVAAQKYQADIEQCLKASYQICAENTFRSKGARPVCRLVEVVLSAGGTVIKPVQVEPSVPASLDDQDLWTYFGPSQPHAALAGSTAILQNLTLQNQVPLEASTAPFVDSDWQHALMPQIGTEEWQFLQQNLDLPYDLQQWGFS